MNYPLKQGWATSVLEGHCPTEFGSIKHNFPPGPKLPSPALKDYNRSSSLESPAPTHWVGHNTSCSTRTKGFLFSEIINPTQTVNQVSVA